MQEILSATPTSGTPSHTDRLSQLYHDLTRHLHDNYHSAPATCMEDTIDDCSEKFILATIKAYHQVVTEGINTGELLGSAFGSASARDGAGTEYLGTATSFYQEAEEICRQMGRPGEGGSLAKFSLEQLILKGAPESSTRHASSSGS